MDIGALGVYLCLFLSLYFEVFLLISFLEKKPSKKTSDLPSRYPTVSMVVPCFNEARTLAGTLESLLALEYPKELLDIIVVDDGSIDSTRAIAEDIASREPRVKYFYKENGGKYTALNFGIAHTTAELVGCLDADSFADPDALIEVVKRFEEDSNVAAIVPVMNVHAPKSILEVMQAAEYTFGIFVKKMFDNIGAIWVVPGPFSVYRRDVFATIGPFHHAHNTEDMEIAFRLQKHGYKILNAHTAFVYTTVPSTIRTLLKQRTRWSQGFLQNSRDYWYMFFNPRFGNLGVFALPFGVAMFFGGLYMTAYMLYHALSSLSLSLYRILYTGVLPHFAWPKLDWFYINTSVVMFVAVVTLITTISMLLIGRTMAKTKFGIVSAMYYFLVYGCLAPIWLARALLGAVLARESAWR